MPGGGNTRRLSLLSELRLQVCGLGWPVCGLPRHWGDLKTTPNETEDQSSYSSSRPLTWLSTASSICLSRPAILRPAPLAVMSFVPDV